MSKVLTEGLSRLQTQSRIPAATWRQWCELLKIESEAAVDVWEEICYPIMVATRKMPEVTYILQLRAERLTPDIFEFKEEIAKVLHFFTFLYNLQDEVLSRGKLKTALLKFYKHVTNRIPDTHSPAVFIERFTVELCLLVLVAKILKGANVSLGGVLKTVGEGRGTLEQVVRLASKKLLEEPYGCEVYNSFADPLAGILEPLAAEEGGAGGDFAEEAPFEGDGSEDDPEDEFVGEDGSGDEITEEGEGDGDVVGFGPDGDDFDSSGRQMEDFLLCFKTALERVYTCEADKQREELDDETVDDLLAARLEVIERFEPFDSSIPSIEEAQNLARRAEVARNPARLRKGRSGISGAVLGGGGGPTASDVKAAIVATQQQKRDDASAAPQAGGDVASEPQLGGDPPAESDARIDMNEVEGVEVAPEEVLEVPEISADEFSDRVRQVARLLAGIDKADRTVWNLFLEPASSVADPVGLARSLGNEKSGPSLACEAVRGVAQCVALKAMMPQDGTLQNERNFSIKVGTFINQISNNNREIAPDSRPLAPLKTILDNAGSCLLRLEALRINQRFADEMPQNYTRDAVTLYYESALRAVTDPLDRQLLGLVRKRADADTYALLEVFAARSLVEQVVGVCREYALELGREGHAESAEAVREAIQTAPVQFDGVERQEAPMPTDEDMGLPAGLGEVYDEVCRHVCTEARAVLEERHDPAKALERIRQALRQGLAPYLRFQVEKKRHMEMPQIGLAVVGLDKVSGNSTLKDLFVRLRDDGGVMMDPEYEDGTFADIFELREYQPMRMASNQQKKAAAEGEEVLQTGHKYLYSVGRTCDLFGATPSDVINGCVRKEDGGIRVFASFN